MPSCYLSAKQNLVAVKPVYSHWLEAVEVHRANNQREVDDQEDGIHVVDKDPR